ncbi:entericidin EcnA/B family protein [Marinovum sp. 2_MG-2023]|nr:MULTISPECIES: entericidin EcnA/B family protein [Roseobacteraceae]MCJ7871969.1 entericidin EcnA/B family protein [Phaeobacter sp. J2-8]MDO6731571.1 entericidin EcnA/B family protein [Marinovum sp. 2_MG-2023]MDO6778303.1 entericidin EcnA/B family protein [Marinovum sp. 1_MG-2023]
MRAFCLVTLMAALTTLAACNTVEGVGRDISDGARSVKGML